MSAFEVEKTRLQRGEGGAPPLVEFTVTAPDFPNMAIVMTYSIVGGIALQSVKISSVAREEGQRVAAVSPGILRNLPLATWDRSLVMRAWAVLRHPANTYLYRSLPDVPQTMGNYQPDAAVDELYPGLAEDDTKAGQRRYKSLINLAGVAREYADLLWDGEKNPTGRIAEMENVKPATVRSWLHRAKAAGFYPLFGLDDSPRTSGPNT